LVAYVAAEAEGAATSSVEWQRYLQQQLPEYMVPAQYVELAALPLTAIGKLDRRALAQLEPEWSAAVGASVAARSPVEEMLQSVWQELLRREPVGMHENFFALGGHSLLATRLISRVRVLFQIELPLRALFDAPTIAGLAEQVEQALGAEGVLRTSGITVVSRAQPLPLSYAQERLWFLDQLRPGSALYNVPKAVLVSGELSLSALEQSLSEIVRRHEILRTRFVAVDGESVQVIESATSISFEVLDLSIMPEAEREQEMWRRIRSEATQPFDLSRGPLLRVRVLRLSAWEHVVMLTMHHIISDGWSRGVMIYELAALYPSFLSGEPSPLPELPIQYADFAMWQRQWLSGVVLDGQLEYWRRQLSGELPVLALEPDKVPSGPQHYQGAMQDIRLGGELSEQLRELSLREGITLFMALLAGWQLLLSRYSGQEDICVGTPIANRNRAETENLIGFFVNTLVLRTDLSGDLSVRELLGRVREVCLGAYGHQDMPFEKLVEALQPQRDLRRTPLFQTMFLVQNGAAAALELPGLQLQSLESGGNTVEFDLTLSLSDDLLNGIFGQLSYRTELYEAETMARLAESYQRVLRAIVAEPGRQVSEVQLLSTAERRQILEAWNDTRREYRGAETIAELFEAQVEGTPGATAVVFEGVQLTYAELNCRANQLAHYLRAQEVRVDEIVGVLMERSLEMVVALLGILKAGAAYLPLDPGYPRVRLEQMIADAAVSVVLTARRQQQLATEVAANVGILLYLDDQWAEAENDANLNVNVDPQNLAYVIYTSGSTGRPKGVMNTHRGICNRLFWVQDAYPLTPADRVLQKTPFSFDVSVWEFFWPLLTGACLVIAEPGSHGNPDYLCDIIEQQRVTVMHFVPAMLQIFLEEPRLERCSSLRKVICSGEALGFALQQQFFARLGSELHNLYGPTEAAVEVTHWTCIQNSARNIVPIGRPISNTQIYLLDRNYEPVPIGVAGELHIGGVNLARGYHGNPALTAEKFVSDPFSAKPGARLYKTGDLARYLQDGNIEFLGRMDSQVKLRGFRIELGEIEAVLNQHASVKEAVVVTHEVAPGKQSLVAYMRLLEGAETEVSELRAYLKDRLPEYMVPAHYVRLAELPLTANGKLDRQALARLDPLGEAHSETEHVAARDLVEHKLVQIWEDLLKVKPIGVKDDFFELGGHSLLAVSLMARIYSSLGQKLPLSHLFQGKTIEALAQLLRNGDLQTGHHPALVGIQPNGSEQPLFCVHAVGGTVFSYAGLARHLGSQRPFYGLQAKGLDGKHQPHASVEEMATYYIEAVHSVQPDGPYLLAGWSMGGTIALEMARQLREHGQEVARLLLLDTAPDHGNNSQTVIPDHELPISFLNHAGIRTDTLVITAESLQQMTPDEQLAHILDLARANMILPPDTKLVDVRHLFEVYKTNLSADRSYLVPPVPCSITLFKASEQQESRRNEIIDQWRALASAAFEVQLIPGNHFSMLREPNVEFLADALKKSLDEAPVHRFVSDAD
jgi:amino acid adenylation domain-containing protein